MKITGRSDVTMYEQKPLVSIIIPVYNSQDYIKECLLSAINQKYRAIEIIVVNDGSVDNSVGIINTLACGDSRIKVLHSANNGAGIARNIGFGICAGKYITYLDSDDFLPENYIENLLSEAIKYEADIIRCSNFRFTFVAAGFNSLPFYSASPGDPFILADMGYGPCGMLIKRELLEKDVSFPPLSSVEDLFFSALLYSLAGKMVFIKEAMYGYRLPHGNSVSNRKDLQANAAKALLLLYERKETNRYLLYIFMLKNLMSCVREMDCIFNFAAGFKRHFQAGPWSLIIDIIRKAPERDILFAINKMSGKDKKYSAAVYKYIKYNKKPVSLFCSVSIRNIKRILKGQSVKADA